ncbi:hypothetical protein J7E97_16340 [Streptomyces sp. ISL-66]|uniref:hypothetical protein n=1 Tax=Streptomyces sp. ISL-66 TaxID=2819186 RepID=UPI001BEA3A1A|nr:hypothetical protein [Streptomyces sp. ISL-66]MBT2469402.1 hypothetical protein [Streptomyces sp. ISL-66]
MAGDHISIHGAGGIGKASHTGSGDIVAGGKYAGGATPDASAVEKLLEEVRAMRQHLDESDRAEVDEAVAEIQANPSQERFGKLLRTFSGIATVIGEAGVPVIAAIKALLG